MIYITHPWLLVSVLTRWSIIRKIISSKVFRQNNDKNFKLSQNILLNQYFYKSVLYVLYNVALSVSSTVIKIFLQLRCGFSKPAANMISGKVRNSRAHGLISINRNCRIIEFIIRIIEYFNINYFITSR